MDLCEKCNGTGVLDTGNNEVPCDCLAGDMALFNTVRVIGPITGQEIKRHFLNNSPKPLDWNIIYAIFLSGREGKEAVNMTLEHLETGRQFITASNMQEVLEGKKLGLIAYEKVSEENGKVNVVEVRNGIVYHPPQEIIVVPICR